MKYEILQVLEAALPELEAAGLLDLHWKFTKILRKAKEEKATGSPASPASPPRVQ